MPVSFAALRSAGSFLLKLWALAAPYWSSEERWTARGLLALITALNLATVYLSVLFNEWNQLFYDALQEKDADATMHQLLRFTYLAFAFIAVAVYQLYLTQLLQIRWRRWLTDLYVRRWLDRQVYYRLQLKDYGTDNPEQRVEQDIKIFTQLTLGLGMGLLNAVVTLVSFLSILWLLSGPLAVTVGGATFAIPGYMVWVAIVYALGGSLLTHWIGRPLIAINFNQQRFDADFRFRMTRVRENAESVALYRGEAMERAGLAASFANIWRNWRLLMTYQKRLTWLTSGYGQLAIIFPFVVGLPRYFSGAIQLGGLMQIASAFGQVQGALSWFVDMYPNLAEFKATTDRLTGFASGVAQAEAEVLADDGIRRVEGAAPDLAVADLALLLPDGKALLDKVDLEIAPGSAVLLAGPSGSGKTTLFRALAGIWPFGRGSVRLPAGARTLFLPQKPYLPIGTLREAACYPDAPDAHDDAAIREALAASRLPHLIDRLDESGNWSLTLSPGEQQRLAVARALLVRPDWLFLDEATSALDEATEAELYRLLRQRLPKATVISIAHRPGVARFHGEQLTILPERRTLARTPLPALAG